MRDWKKVLFLLTKSSYKYEFKSKFYKSEFNFFVEESNWESRKALVAYNATAHYADLDYLNSTMILIPLKVFQLTHSTGSITDIFNITDS